MSLSSGKLAIISYIHVYKNKTRINPGLIGKSMHQYKRNTGDPNGLMDNLLAKNFPEISAR